MQSRQHCPHKSVFEAAPSHMLWTQQQDPYRCYFHSCSRRQQLCFLAARCATAQPRAWSPSTQIRHLQDCTTAPTWDCMPKALGVWRHRPWGCCTARSSPHMQTGNGQDKHPDQIPRHGQGQTDLFARSGHKMHHISPSTCRAGLCPLPKCCSSCVSVNRALKSRGWLLCTQRCGERWARSSGPPHTFNRKQLQIYIIT